MNNDYNNNMNNNSGNNNSNNDIYYGRNNFQSTYYSNAYNNQRKEEEARRRYYTYNAQQNMTNNYNSYVDKSKISSAPSKEKLKYGKVIIPIILIAIIASLVFLFVGTDVFKEGNKKTRTFMIYMVGSDLESKSMQGTYSISEIVGDKIDLENNNIVLIAGGANKWHNFISADEVSIYELTNDGFVKVKQDPVINMGDSNTLTEFLNYAYNNYPAQKYDMIFWNHGMGSIGLEHDEVSGDFIDIYELDDAFSNSKFKNNKLELAIFYNCLTENMQMASVMSKYADYMLGSEEVLYLSKLFNRLSFFEKVQKTDSAYDIAKHFISISDDLIDNYNDSHYTQINSTLSFLDLSKVEQLEKDLDKYINSIDVAKNYYNIAIIRKNIYTYGKAQNNNYDTIDLYSLVDALSKYSTNKDLKDTVLNDINELVVMNSSFDNYSHGLAVYFPYYNTYKNIEAHLSVFETMWEDSYYVKFIRQFNNIRYNNYRSTRSTTGKEVNELKNNASFVGDTVEIELTEHENSKYQDANVYIFNKAEDGTYELLLKSNKVTKDNNKLVFNYDGLLSINGNNLSYDETDNVIYGNLANKDDNLDVIFKLQFNDNNAVIRDTILDSGENPLSSIIDLNDYSNISLTNIRYDLLNNGELKEDWKENITRNNIELSNIDEINISKEKTSLNGLYVMFEMYDIDNDAYYSKLTKVE